MPNMPTFHKPQDWLRCQCRNRRKGAVYEEVRSGRLQLSRWQKWERMRLRLMYAPAVASSNADARPKISLDVPAC
jgi:hypothetical protein